MTTQDLFSIDVRADRVVISGELDMACVSEMSRAVLRLAFLSARQVELDLSNVTFMDCSGLGALLLLQRSVSPFVVVVSAAVQRVLDLTDSGLIFNPHTPLIPAA